LVENQLTPETLHTLLENVNTKEMFPEQPVESWESTDVERGVGGFAGYALPHDWGIFLSHACCTGNASRTLYWIWDSILTKEADAVTVNLPLNRASPWLDVDSHLPYEGKVVLTVKQASEVTVRLPEGTERQRTNCDVNGQMREPARSGNCVEVKPVKPGDKITVTFPIEEETLSPVIGRCHYRVAMKGNTVVALRPTEKAEGRQYERHLSYADGPGAELAPLYQRDRYTHDEAPMERVTRFASESAIRW